MCAYSSCQFGFAITEEEPGFSSPSTYYLMCIPIHNYTEIHPQIWQTERALEQTRCRSCAVSPVCDTHTRTHARTHAALTSHVCSTHHTAVCNTNIMLNYFKGATRNTVGWSAKNWKKRQYSGNLLNGLKKTKINHSRPGIRIPQKARRPRHSARRRRHEYWSCIDNELLQNRTRRTKWRIRKIV